MKHCERLINIEAFSDYLNLPILELENFNIEDIDKFINRANYPKYINEFILSNNIKDNTKYGYEYVIDYLEKLIKD